MNESISEHPAVVYHRDLCTGLQDRSVVQLFESISTYKCYIYAVPTGTAEEICPATNRSLFQEPRTTDRKMGDSGFCGWLITHIIL
jgi:hypothetical protein